MRKSKIKHDHVHIRGWRITRENLKRLAQHTGESMASLLDRLVLNEADKKKLDL
jgi:hypothetical protein